MDLPAAHPLSRRRLLPLFDLLNRAGLLQPADPALCLPPSARRDDVVLVHHLAYVDAVERLSQPSQSEGEQERHQASEKARYSLGGEQPVLVGVHEAATRIVGGTLAAAQAVLDGRACHAFHPAGGRHHALPGRASGGDLYNDAAVAIAALLCTAEPRVLYVDFDGHQGDGVQWAFYDEPQVLTVSFHETGRSLFPGTGDLLELGQGTGRGFAVNLPVAAGTEDASWLEVLTAVLPFLAERFRPDLIISQHGCDTHAWDALTHLALTTRAAQVQAQLVHALAHTYCQGRWVALGGGGTEIYRVLPRAWALVWAELAERPCPAQLPAVWRARWQPESAEALPQTFVDPPEAVPARPDRPAIERYNRGLVRQFHRLLLPVSQAPAAPSVPRAAFPAIRPQASGAGVPDLLQRSGCAPTPRVRILETPRGRVLLRDWCPPSLIGRLRPDEGLHAFGQRADREQAQLAAIAARPDGEVIIAQTTTGDLIGQISLGAGEGWWGGIPDLYEIALDISATWRRLGLARAMLTFALEPPYMEEVIVYGVGYVWHWDLRGSGLDPLGYRTLLCRLLHEVGFEEYTAQEPNLQMDPANLLLARIGRHAPSVSVQQFRARLGGAVEEKTGWQEPLPADRQ
jgi:acetoin utilization deacetylase AcuC-like enzyme